MDQPTPQPGQRTVMQQLAPYMNLGAQLTTPILVMGAVGWYADEQWHTTPTWLVVGLVAGIGLGGFQFIRTVRRLTRDDEQQRMKRGNSGS